MVPAPERIRVLLADDEVLIRSGVRAILETDPRIDVIAEASDGREAVELSRRHRPDVALLDIRMPGLDGFEASREIAIQTPRTRVIILTTFGEDDYIRAAFGGGASGFLLKASDPRELIVGVHAVFDGAAYLTPRIAQRVIGHYRSDGGGHEPAGRRDHESGKLAERLVERLTGRERDVLALLGAGLSNAEIGHRLHLVEGTVKGHVSSILIKLEARNRVQAAIIAYEAGLVPPTVA